MQGLINARPHQPAASRNGAPVDAPPEIVMPRETPPTLAGSVSPALCSARALLSAMETPKRGVTAGRGGEPSSAPRRTWAPSTPSWAPAATPSSARPWRWKNLRRRRSRGAPCRPTSCRLTFAPRCRRVRRRSAGALPRLRRPLAPGGRGPAALRDVVLGAPARHAGASVEGCTRRRWRSMPACRAGSRPSGQARPEAGALRRKASAISIRRAIHSRARRRSSSCSTPSKALNRPGRPTMRR